MKGRACSTAHAFPASVARVKVKGLGDFMKAPQNLDEAKAIARAEKAKLTNALSAIAGSRWLLAILATFTLAFGHHSLYAPERLPRVDGLSFQQMGLPPSVDFGYAAEIHEAALRQGARERVREAVAGNPELNPVFNLVGFGTCLLLLAGNLWIMTRRRRFTRG